MTTTDPKLTDYLDDSIRKPALLGLTTIGVFFLVLLLWSVLAPIQGAAVAQGKVAIKENRLTVEHRDGGIITELNVREGDQVEAGDVLIRLETTELQADLDIYQQAWDAAVITQARLEAEQHEQPMVFPAQITDRLPNEPQLQRLVSGQQVLLEANRQALSGAVALTHKRIAQLEQQIKGLKVLETLARERLSYLKADLKSMQALHKKGYSSQLQVTTLQRDIAKEEGELSSILTNINEAHGAIAEQTTYITTLELNHTQKLVQELSAVQEQLLELEPTLTKMTDRLQRSAIIAPASGVVLGLNQFTKGGVINSGEPIMDIVPSSGHLIVEARFRPGDIDEIIPGMVAKVRFTAYNFRDYLPIDGVLQRISADVVMDERTQETAYIGQIEVAVNNLMAQDITLYPGMPAEVMVTLNQRSVVSYLFEPLLRSFNRALRES